jgi:hypothetical protein
MLTRISEAPTVRVRSFKERILVEYSYSQEEFIAMNDSLGGDMSQFSQPSSAAPTLFNNAPVDFDDVHTDNNVDVYAFDVATDGAIRTGCAIRQAKSRAARVIIDAIKSVGTLQQQALAFQSALSHPELRHVAKAVILDKGANRALSFQWKQLRELIQVAVAKDQQRGHVNQDRAAFLESILTAVAPDSVNKHTPSQRSRALQLGGVPLTTMHRKESVCCGKRKALKAGNAATSWSKVARPRKGYSKLRPEVQQAVCDAILIL